MMQFKDLEKILNGRSLQIPRPDQNIRHLLTDSRKSFLGKEALFFAIPGPNHDGHDYLDEVYSKGCRQFILERQPGDNFPQANIYIVNDAVAALQSIATKHRQQFGIPIIGLSGSNGKTIVKEWLSQLLSLKMVLVKSPKSYNSQIGVPLSVWQITERHEIGIFEAGNSLPGEMQKLQPLIQPEFGIFTNLGPAHDEGFRDRYQKATEKATLFKDAKQLIYRREYPELDAVLKRDFPGERLVSWTTHRDRSANWKVEYVAGEGNQTEILLSGIRKQAVQFEFQFGDQASLENITHCIIFLLEQGWRSEEIQEGLKTLRPVRMRLEMKEGVNRCYVLDDSYSNDLAGLEIALNHLLQQKQHNKNTIILSDLLQTGFDKEELYTRLYQLLQAFPIQRLILIGSDSFPFRQTFEKTKWDFQHFRSTEDFLHHLDTAHFADENVLVKGARVFGFERIVMRLQQKIHGTVLEINLDAITHNLNFYRSRLKKGCRLMVMVKAFSYGGAAFEIANLLQFHGVDYLAVAYADEGIMLRQHGIRIPILVLNPSPESFSLMVQHQLEPEIYSLTLLQKWLPYASTDLPVHLKMDTGMHRLGFMEHQLPKLMNLLEANSGIRVKSIFTHLVASEDRNEDAFTHEQLRQYQRMYERLRPVLDEAPMRHVLNSAGILRFPGYQLDMVRLGLGLYGVDSSGAANVLRPISRLKTVISQIREIPAGDSVGYNRAAKVEEPRRIATLAIGYADGLDRRLGNGRLNVWIKGQPAPTIGNICMDMTMVDISGIEAEEGDEAVIFGEEQSVKVLAERMNTIPYEVLTNISERVKRVFYADS